MTLPNVPPSENAEIPRKIKAKSSRSITKRIIKSKISCELERPNKYRALLELVS
jgi:hypothetical protein